MSAFEPRDWHTLDMATKVRLFSLQFPPHQVLRELRAGQGLTETPFLQRIYTEEMPPPLSPPRLVRHDTSIGGWVAERACPYAPVKPRVSFKE